MVRFLGLFFGCKYNNNIFNICKFLFQKVKIYFIFFYKLMIINT